MELERLGWKPQFNEAIKSAGSGLVPVRVICQYNHIYQVIGEMGEMSAELSGKMKYSARSQSELPSVGDWVLLEPNPSDGNSLIETVLPRISKLSRKKVGDLTEEQILSSNIDIAFLVSGMDEDYNPRRIERYVTLAWDSGANPVIILNKADLRDNMDAVITELEVITPGVDIVQASAETNIGMDEIIRHLPAGKTGVFLGSSGVGKSSIINRLLGVERQKIGEVHIQTKQGKHTTRTRELIILPHGGMVIDTPGMREIQLWKDEAVTANIFDEIEELANLCHFRDCQHQTEPGCAIRAALDSGELDRKRYESYMKLKKEQEYLESRKEESFRRKENLKWKKISQLQKDLKRNPKRK